MTIFNLGSLNIDRVFSVPHIVASGETISSHSLQVFAGGKGANQSIALARAGARVAHIGRVGHDGRWLMQLLDREGIDVSRIVVGSTDTGQALIQVDSAGQNAIVLTAGANREITPHDVDHALTSATAGDWLLAQNETSCVAHAIRRAKALDLRVAWNPAPCDDNVLHGLLDLVDLLCVNETEAAALAGQGDPAAAGDALATRLPHCEIVLTLSAKGATVYHAGHKLHMPASIVDVVDTTAAGDTFLGYYLAARSSGQDIAAALALATRAAASCVTRAGALDSIPHRDQLS